jgi:2,3-bisphosphoglycerate-dependent phosphoglycerate mutase
MILEGLNKDEILERELATGAPILYRLGADGRAIDRKDLLPPRSLAAPPEDRIM